MHLEGLGQLARRVVPEPRDLVVAPRGPLLPVRAEGDRGLREAVPPEESEWNQNGLMC